MIKQNCFNYLGWFFFLHSASQHEHTSHHSTLVSNSLQLLQHYTKGPYTQWDYCTNDHLFFFLHTSLIMKMKRLGYLWKFLYDEIQLRKWCMYCIVFVPNFWMKTVLIKWKFIWSDIVWEKFSCFVEIILDELSSSALESCVLTTRLSYDLFKSTIFRTIFLLCLLDRRQEG